MKNLSEIAPGGIKISMDFIENLTQCSLNIRSSILLVISSSSRVKKKLRAKALKVWQINSHIVW